MRTNQGLHLLKFTALKFLCSCLLGFAMFVTIGQANTVSAEEDPELTWIGSEPLEEGQNVEGLALIEYGDRWEAVYLEEDLTLEESSHVNYYEGNDSGLELELERMNDMLEEGYPMLEWTGSTNKSAGAEISGLALIETQEEWIPVYSEETEVMQTDGHVNYYEGNDQGLTEEYERLQEEKEEGYPELTWTHSVNREVGEEIGGLALVEYLDKWVKVYKDDMHLMQKSGHVNYYEGNNAGLEEEYIRVTN